MNIKPLSQVFLYKHYGVKTKLAIFFSPLCSQQLYTYNKKNETGCFNLNIAPPPPQTNAPYFDDCFSCPF